ncbi:MAG: hypothetical protein H6Q25_143 [Bacteroidetes bacterium]|nr:hypothetical protein [Bacteroidota bacterium]
MNLLHNNKKDFFELINIISRYYNISTTFVEKDYWITLVLNRLACSKDANSFVFKGGTSLSKGFHLIDRFSEDIDIAMIKEELSGNAIKSKLRSVEKEISVDLNEIDEPEITSKGSMFRKSVFQYPSFSTDRLRQNNSNRLIIEINSFANPYPYSRQTIQSLITQYLKETQQESIINKYNLIPFELNVLDKTQTMIEKLISLIRFSFDSFPERALAKKVRHFYDLFYLMNDEQCITYLKSDLFQKDLLTLLKHDQNSFDTPLGWNIKKNRRVPIIN